MKNLIKVILASMLCFTLCGCQSEDSNSQNTEQPQVNNEENNKKNETNYKDKLPIEEIFILREYCINFPAWSVYDSAYLKICNNQESIISIVDTDEDTTSTNDAHDKAIKCYIDNIYMEAPVLDVIVKNECTEIINGIEMYRYEGYAEIQLDREVQEAYAIGYSFVLEGKACTLIGVILDLDQTQEMMDEMEDTVDLMIQTLRPVDY